MIAPITLAHDPLTRVSCARSSLPEPAIASVIRVILYVPDTPGIFTSWPSRKPLSSQLLPSVRASADTVLSTVYVPA